MQMSQPFRVAQGDITVVGTFAEPAFSALRDLTPLYKALYDSLNRFGLRLADMRVVTGIGNLAEAHLFCSLPNVATNIRVLVDKVEVVCFDSLRVDQQQFVEIAQSTAQTVGGMIANNTFKSYALTANLHGFVEGTTTREYLTKITGPGPKNLGPLIGSGVVFYYGAEADRLTAFLTVDLSGLRAGAVYVRQHVEWDGAKVKLADVPTATEKFFRTGFEGIGLDWPALPPK